MTKYQEAEDKQAEMFAQIQKKLYKTTEALNGVQTQALAIWGKAIQQGASDNITSLRRSKDVKKETDLGVKSLATKERLKAADEYLVRLRHKLNMQQEKEHGAQVRRNINLRGNMDSFNDALNNVKKAITGGAGFQSAIGTTVSKMARMTRSYQELELANKKRTDTAEQLQLKTDTVNNLQGSDDKEAKKNADDALKIAQSAHQRAEEGVLAATNPAQGTQGMFKPLFEKLGKLGEFLGKKAIPIGIGVGVAGIFLSIIVKAFSASPLFAAMMKMMKFMVTLILMPIGTFFGALLRPILIMLLRKLIVPMFSKWMPKLMAWGSAIGDWLIKDKSDKFEDDPEKKDIKDMNWLERLSGITSGKIDITGGTAMADTGDESETSLDKIKDATTGWDSFWTKIITSISSVGIITPIAHAEVGLDGKVISPEIEKSDAIKEEYEGGFRDLTPEEIAATAAAAAEAAMTISDHEREAGMYPVDQEAKDRAAAKAQLEAEAKEEREKPQKDMNNLMNEIIETGTSMINTVGYAARGAQTVNPNTGRLSSEAYSNAGISQEALDRANAPKGHVTSDNYSPATKALLASMNSGVIPAASGFDGMVNRPTMFLAGESGSEHVKVTPSGSGGGSGGITVNIQNMNGSDNDLRKLKKTILEVIQESSANRGRL